MNSSANTKKKNWLCSLLGHKFKRQEYYGFDQCQRCWITQAPLKVEFECTNCLCYGDAYVNKRQEIVAVKCPNCGCETLTLR